MLINQMLISRDYLYSALFLACQAADVGSAEVLLSAGADVNQKAGNGAMSMWLACQIGNLPIVQLLSSYGAARGSGGTEWRAADVARFNSFLDVADWLNESAFWSTPLHHATFISMERARKLLREGADIRAAATSTSPTPLSLAKAAPAPALGSAANLVLQASLPWSPHTHDIFPSGARRVMREWSAPGWLYRPVAVRARQITDRGPFSSKYACGRARAVELLKLGHLLFLKEARFNGLGAAGLNDLWKERVIPFAVRRREDWDPLAANTRVRIQGVVSKPELNGELASVVRLEPSGQYVVSFIGKGPPCSQGGPILLKRDCLACV